METTPGIVWLQTLFRRDIADHFRHKVNMMLVIIVAEISFGKSSQLNLLLSRKKGGRNYILLKIAYLDGYYFTSCRY